jgi:hypothetical protein
MRKHKFETLKKVVQLGWIKITKEEIYKYIKEMSRRCVELEINGVSRLRGRKF